VPIVKTSDDFLPEKQPAKKSQPAKRDTSLPGYLSRPPVPEYSQEEIFSGRLSEGRRDEGEYRI
jgi:hypothetical protein